MADVADRLFGADPNHSRMVLPAALLAHAEVRADFLARAQMGVRPVTYFQDKLGGEISISKTDRSPELAFDITLVEILASGNAASIGRYGILEVQTMDFHGSYRRVVKNLTDALRLHRSDFHSALEKNQEWLSELIEGPNIANVFKRTFYQIMMKFQIGAQRDCAGAVLAIPQSVWDSWQRHLAKPALEARADGDYELRKPGCEGFGNSVPAWIYIFDIDASGAGAPNEVRIVRRVATEADAVSYYALKIAPQVALGEGGSADLIPERIRKRLLALWPEFGSRHGS